MSTQFFIDLDGTLTDISNRHYGVYASCVKELGGAPLEKDHYWALKRSDVKWENILPLSGLKVADEAVFITAFISKIETFEWLRVDTLLPGVEEALSDLSERYTLVLVSLRRNRDELLSQLKHLSIDHYFAAVLSGHSDTKEGTLLKKAEVIQEFGYSQESVIVGDTEADVAAGQQLGIVSFAVLSGIRDKDFLEKRAPNYIVSALPEVLSCL